MYNYNDKGQLWGCASDLQGETLTCAPSSWHWYDDAPNYFPFPRSTPCWPAVCFQKILNCHRHPILLFYEQCTEHPDLMKIYIFDTIRQNGAGD